MKFTKFLAFTFITNVALKNINIFRNYTLRVGSNQDIRSHGNNYLPPTRLTCPRTHSFEIVYVFDCIKKLTFADFLKFSF